MDQTQRVFSGCRNQRLAAAIERGRPQHPVALVLRSCRVSQRHQTEQRSPDQVADRIQRT
jgi:hypothetical protein